MSFPNDKPDESRTGSPTFTEDFLLEHSRFGQQGDSIEFAGEGRTLSPDKRTSRSATETQRPRD